MNQQELQHLQQLLEHASGTSSTNAGPTTTTIATTTNPGYVAATGIPYPTVVGSPFVYGGYAPAYGYGYGYGGYYPWHHGWGFGRPWRRFW